MSVAVLTRPDFLKASQIPIWVVITGNVRSGKEFRRMFGQALELREKGLVDGIRFVTWQGELEQAPGLEHALTRAGISILTIAPPRPDPKVHPLFHGYVYHQRKCLQFGLRSLPQDCFVLKARTDFAEERFDAMVATLFGTPGLSLQVEIASPVIGTRLFSYDVRPDYLFYWDDIVFSGLRDDLLKVNNFDLGYQFIHPGHISCAETQLFSPLFLRHYPVLAWFFENVHGESFSQILQRWVSGGCASPLPALVMDILAAYFHILSRYVVLPQAAGSAAAPLTLGAFFTPCPELGVKRFSHPWASHKLVSQCLLERLRGPEAFADAHLAALAAAMRKMDADASTRGALSPTFEDDLRCFTTFGESLGIKPLIAQTQLIPAQVQEPFHAAEFLDAVELPEKRQLSRWQQRQKGARTKAATWVLQKLL